MFNGCSSHALIKAFLKDSKRPIADARLLPRTALIRLLDVTYWSPDEMTWTLVDLADWRGVSTNKSTNSL